MLDALARCAQRAEAFVDRLDVGLELERERRTLEPRPLAPPRQRPRGKLATAPPRSSAAPPYARVQLVYNRRRSGHTRSRDGG